MGGGSMGISLLKALLNNLSSLFSLSSRESLDSEPVRKYYAKIEKIPKLLNPVLNAIVDLEVVANELFTKEFAELGQVIDEMRELFETWHPLMSKVYFVLQIELLISKARNSGLEILMLLKSLDESLPAELSSASLENCIKKIKVLGCDETYNIVKEAIRDEAEGEGASSDSLIKLAASLNLQSNQELLIEVVALEKLKETTEQAENNVEAEYIDKIIALVTHMHDRLIMIKQSESDSPIAIPPDFCCPLSLELMTDPVIVSSGQTYERAYIREWIDLGLTVCPKTRQTLSHTNLIPNYTVKALIANWCESNNVKLPDPVRAMVLNQSSITPRDTPILRTRSNELTSPASTGVPGKNLNGFNRELMSPSHPRSSSEGSLPSVVVNGHALDIGRMSLESSGEQPTDSEERVMDPGDQPSVSPSRDEEFTSGADNQASHKRASSASIPLSNLGRLRVALGDGTGASQASTYSTADSSDNSGEMTSEPQAAPLGAQQRESEFPRRLGMRSQNQVWRRPSERFVPRIVSSPDTETRPDLSGVETQVRKLLEDLKSTSVETQREAITEIRLLAKHNMDNRIVIANCGAISMLVNLLHSADAKTQENAVTALLNLSINDNNKTAIANAGAIEPLIHVLQTGTPEAKENSAATLFSLSVIEDNKIMIGRSGAIGPLVDLLGNGTPRGKKDAATALFNLSIFHENKFKIVAAGAVKHLVELMDPAAGMVDKAVAVLANLATIQDGRVEIGQEQGIPVLVEVVELGSARGKENAAAALLQLCTHSSRFCNMVLQEGAVPPLVALSQSGTPRAKEKAQSLLNCFRNQRHGNGGRN